MLDNIFNKDGVRLETPSFLVGVHGFKALLASGGAQGDQGGLNHLRCQVSGFGCQAVEVRNPDT